MGSAFRRWIARLMLIGMLSGRVGGRWKLNRENLKGHGKRYTMVEVTG
jgi:hypothetical protein